MVVVVMKIFGGGGYAGGDSGSNATITTSAITIPITTTTITLLRFLSLVGKCNSLLLNFVRAVSPSNCHPAFTKKKSGQKSFDLPFTLAKTCK